MFLFETTQTYSSRMDIEILMSAYLNLQILLQVGYKQMLQHFNVHLFK